MAKRDAEATESSKPVEKPWSEWAEAKGHVAVLAKPLLFGARQVQHTGPDVRVVRAYFGWPLGKLMVEADYDKAVDLVYNGTSLR